MKTCGKCGETKAADKFYPRERVCKPCRIAHIAAYKRTEAGRESTTRYRGSEKWKAKQARYEGSEQGKANKARYEGSEKGKAKKARYQGSEEGKRANSRTRRGARGGSPRKSFGPLVGGPLVRAIWEFQERRCAVCGMNIFPALFWRRLDEPAPHRDQVGQTDHDWNIWCAGRDSVDDREKILSAVRGVLDMKCNRTLIEKHRGYEAMRAQVDAYLADPPAQRCPEIIEAIRARP
jgi:hypothetical protein